MMLLLIVLMVIMLVFQLGIIEVFILKLLRLITLLVFSFKINMSVDNIDYEDIYDNIDDYEYPYNHVNRREI